jgi:hypothetical protein
LHLLQGATIYLELVATLNASYVIMAIQRLAIRGGRRKVVYSDNTRNFKGAAKELNDKIAEIDGRKIRASIDKTRLAHKLFRSSRMGDSMREIDSIR